MTAILYNTKSDNREINKSITEISTIDVTLYMDTNLLKPIFKVKTFNNNANYIYVPNLGRYYYIDNYTLSNQCVYLHCSVDVLMSFKTQILNNTYLIKRNEFLKDNKLVDNEIPISCKKQIVTQAVSNDFISQSIQCFILGVI